jgi:hypothetical protein
MVIVFMVQISMDIILRSHVENFNFQWLLIPFFLAKGVIFHGDMILQNLQLISERRV